MHAPGIKSVEQTWQCVQHVLEGHAAAAKAFRSAVPGGKLSMNLDGEWGEALTDSPADVEAAQIHRDYHYGLFADPLYFGRYPESVVKHAPPGLGQISPSLAADLKGSMDLFSFNAYTTRYVKASPGANNPEGLGLANYETVTEDAKGVPLGPVADSSWLIVTPWGFRKALAYLNDRYTPGEMAVTENGVSVPKEDAAPFPAVLHDTFRIDFYDSYLKAATEAVVKDGVPLKTYFAWSLLDNFECAFFCFLFFCFVSFFTGGEKRGMCVRGAPGLGGAGDWGAARTPLRAAGRGSGGRERARTHPWPRPPNQKNLTPSSLLFLSSLLFQGPTALPPGSASPTSTTRTARSGTPRTRSATCPSCGAAAAGRTCLPSTRPAARARARTRRTWRPRRPRRREQQGERERERETMARGARWACESEGRGRGAYPRA